jgi:hypothetical protein
MRDQWKSEKLIKKFFKISNENARTKMFQGHNCDLRTPRDWHFDFTRHQHVFGQFKFGQGVAVNFVGTVCQS